MGADTPYSMSAELKQFIVENLHSVEELEILILLHNRPESKWTAATVSAEIRSARESTTRRLADLRSRKLLSVADEVYRFEPADPKATAIVDELVEAYRQMRFRVIELIFSKPIDALKTFANAFKLKKGDSDGA